MLVTVPLCHRAHCESTGSRYRSCLLSVSMAVWSNYAAAISNRVVQCSQKLNSRSHNLLFTPIKYFLSCINARRCASASSNVNPHLACCMIKSSSSGGSCAFCLAFTQHNANATPLLTRSHCCSGMSADDLILPQDEVNENYGVTCACIEYNIIPSVGIHEKEAQDLPHTDFIGFIFRDLHFVLQRVFEHQTAAHWCVHLLLVHLPSVLYASMYKRRDGSPIYRKESGVS